ncbi:MAG: hypothetical protein JWP75_2557 [Frondihabitans sp.]|nr:hypothetical protein [Frondihabitans sp.]
MRDSPLEPETLVVVVHDAKERHAEDQLVEIEAVAAIRD